MLQDTQIQRLHPENRLTENTYKLEVGWNLWEISVQNTEVNLTLDVLRFSQAT